MDGEKHPGFDNVIPFRQLSDLQGAQEAGSEYSKVMEPHVVLTCTRLGLGSEFIPMFRQHIEDIHIVFYKEDENPAFEQEQSLYVLRTPDPVSGDVGSFKRVLLMSEETIRRRKRLLHEVIPQLDVGRATPENFTGLAVDWVFYEACADALNNACFMQQNWPKYIGNFNGQCSYFQTENTISSNFIYSKKSDEFSVEEDSLNFRKGFGLLMLYDAVLAKGVAKSSTEANWIMNGLRQKFKDAHTSEEIQARLKAIIPSRDMERKWGEFAVAVCDPDIVLDDDPESS